MPVVEEFAGRVDEHFDDEERNVVPLIAEYLSPKEWRKFLAHGSAFVRAHPRRGLALGGIVLDGESAQTRAASSLGNVPLPARTAYKIFGDRIYAGYRGAGCRAGVDFMLGSCELLGERRDAEFSGGGIQLRFRPSFAAFSGP